jgi:hypothetical protein
MGFNSVVLVLNDRLNDITRADFGHKLADAIREYPAKLKPVDLPGHFGQTQVLVVAHADVMQIVAVGGNTGRVIGTGSYSDTDEELLHKLAKRMGFVFTRTMAELSNVKPKKPTLEEVKTLAKEYGWRCIVLKRKSKKP